MMILRETLSTIGGDPVTSLLNRFDPSSHTKLDLLAAYRQGSESFRDVKPINPPSDIPSIRGSISSDIFPDKMIGAVKPLEEKKEE